MPRGRKANTASDGELVSDPRARAAAHRIFELLGIVSAIVVSDMDRTAAEWLIHRLLRLIDGEDPAAVFELLGRDRQKGAKVARDVRLAVLYVHRVRDWGAGSSEAALLDVVKATGVGYETVKDARDAYVGVVNELFRDWSDAQIRDLVRMTEVTMRPQG